MILLTGATGFLGSSLVQRFIMDGSNVVCLVRKKSGFIPALGIKQVVGDLMDFNVPEFCGSSQAPKRLCFVDWANLRLWSHWKTLTS